MALPVYPAGLEYKPSLDAFRVLEATRPPVWTEFEDGPPLGRRSGIGRRAKLAYRIVFEEMADFDRFRVFFEVDLADGTMRFTMPVFVPATGSYVTRTVMIEQGQMSADPFGLGMAVSFTLNVFDW
jgi:hypothetical protein